MKFRHLPFIFEFASFSHKPFLHTVLNACLKSMIVQKSFDLFAFDISIRFWRIKRLSIVENPFLNPAWHASIISDSSF